jgi:predicted nucleic acid-binding protein
VSTYLDASALLRLVLGEPGALKPARLEPAITSALTEVECLRTLDRLHAKRRIGADDLAARRAAVFDLLEAVEVVDLAAPILRRAAEPFPTPLGALDALHLATALLWRERHPRGRAFFATHDEELARAARACGLDVVGGEPKRSTKRRTR